MKLEPKNVFHLYLGGEVMFVGADRVFIKNGDVRRFNIIDLNRMWNDLSDYKLVLRRLTDMNEKELSIASNLSGTTSFALGKLKEGESAIFKEAEHITYLLKQGFDLFGFIDRGLAVDKKELNNKKK